ncbi:MAG: ankyrin repeat domain-containing protein [Candidatus Babeliales bacterium]
MNKSAHHLFNALEERGNKKLVQTLLNQGVALEQKNDRGQTPLLFAASNPYIDYEIIKLLLQHGAPVNSTTPDGWTPLLEAVTAGRDGIVELLLQYGADVNVMTHDGTALIIATIYCHKEIAELLIQHGAHINSAMHDGTTALLIAAQGTLPPRAFTHTSYATQRAYGKYHDLEPEYYKEMLELLLLLGADGSLQDNSGKTAFDYITINLLVLLGRTISCWLKPDSSSFFNDHFTYIEVVKHSFKNVFDQLFEYSDNLQKIIGTEELKRIKQLKSLIKQIKIIDKNINTTLKKNPDWLNLCDLGQAIENHIAKYDKTSECIVIPEL